jgi:hypothetical protein
LGRLLQVVNAHQLLLCQRLQLIHKKLHRFHQIQFSSHNRPHNHHLLCIKEGKA